MGGIWKSARPTLALVMAVAALAGSACRAVPDAGSVGVGELMAALGPRRMVEPRLTGASFYAQCREVWRPAVSIPDSVCSTAPPPGSADLATLARVRHRVWERSISGFADLQSRGLDRLVRHHAAGATGQAVALLRRAAAGSRTDAHIGSDLAAALYVQAQESGEPRDLLMALAAAETAVATDAALPEALFNHALILERLFLTSEAAAAWERYLAVDSKSGWASEARARLARLLRPAVPARWSLRLPEIRSAARRSDERAVGTLVAVSLQAARQYAVEEVLGTWGGLVLAGRTAQASDELRLAAAIGGALARRHGDLTVAAAVAAIRRAAGQPRLLASLARGHRAYRLGSAAFARLEVEAAAAPLRLARDILHPAGSPVSLWAEVGLAGIAFYDTRYENAAAGFAAVLERTDPERFPALAGRASWGLGLTRLRQGLLSPSLARHREAASFFARAGEDENLGAVLELLGEDYRMLGDGGAAWQHLHQALRVLCSYPASIRLHNALWQAGDEAREEIDPRVALRFQDEGVRVAQASTSPRLIAESLLWRSKILVALGDFGAARQDLRRADSELARIPDGVVREKLRADLTFAHAEVERRIAPLQALPLFHEAVGYYHRHGLVLDLAIAYLSRARTALSAGDEGTAEADLDAAIDLFERKRGEMQEDGLRLSYSDTKQEVFDERILLEESRGRPVRAFEFSERARSVPLGLGGAARTRARADAARSGAPIGLRLARLPADAAFVEYAWIGDRLLRWTIRRTEVRLEPIDRARRELAARVERFLVALRTGSGQQLDRDAKTLYEDLIPPAARSLPAGEGLWFVPDKALNQVPFAALVDPATGKHLVEEHRAVGVVLSVGSYLDALERPGSPPLRWNALLVANPAFDRRFFPELGDLPQADAEIAELRHLYPGARVLAGANATKASFLAGIDGQEVLEYAGHAIDDPKRPAYARLVLAPSGDEPGALFVHELGGLRLRKLRLVVLSACHTISMRDRRVGGVSGLARPFLDAGAQAVLGTLWDVDDSTARWFLPEFHRRFRAAGDPAVALRETQLACLHGADPALRSPRAWAAFLVVGAIAAHPAPPPASPAEQGNSAASSVNVQ
jgi:CHAT domain-containing protein/tetratricopeptide (TPR) repeat protein